MADDERSGNNSSKILDAVKKTKLCAAKAVAAANSLPMRAEGYELCASFPAYANLMVEQQRRIMVLLRETLRNAGCRAVVPARVNDLDEFLDRLVEANDSICERAGILLDLLQKAGRMEEVVVPQHIIDAESTAAASEKSLFERQGRYTALLRRLPGYTDKLSTAAAIPALPLLTAKEKPQIVYGIPVDNSSTKFKTKLKEKHHALENRISNLRIVDSGANSCAEWLSDEESSAHPYHEELTHFKIPERQLAAGLVQPFRALSDTELIYIDTLEKLQNLRDLLNTEKEFAVDIEHNCHRSYLGLICLMQISTRKTDYIIDPFPLWNDMHILNEPFTDPNILKVFHGAESDVAWLQRDFGIYVVNMFDTYKAMKALDYTKFSYQHLIQMCCNLTLDKQLQKADWRLRPLTDAHIRYARSDTHYLLYCYDLLRKRLVTEGNESNNLLEHVYYESVQVYEKPIFDSEGYKKMSLEKKLSNSRQEFALKALWKWRDERARTDDESPQYVLPKHMLLQIAQVLPREVQGILACCSPVPVHVKRELHALHRIICTARDQPLEKSRDNNNTANNIDALTFESVISQLNKMNAVKALLRCHLDFSSTKYNEEIRHVVTQKIDIEDAATTSSNNGRGGLILSTDIYTIGGTVADMKNENEHLTNVLKKLEEWATPYECYRIAMMEQKSKAKVEIKEAEKNADENVSTESTPNGKKLWSHLDPAANKPGFTESKASAAELKMESERRKIAEDEKDGIDEGMILTKKELRKKRKRETRQITIPTTQGTVENTKSGTDIVVPKKDRKSNWTVAAEKCDEQVDYSAFDSTIFKKGAQMSGACDPFRVGQRGRPKSRPGKPKFKGAKM